MLPNLAYNRSARQYEVHTPDGVETFPAGKDGRRSAHRYALATIAPDVVTIAVQIIHRFPVLETRAWRACEIVADGGVTFQPAPNVLAAVASQSDDYGGDYTLVRGADGLIYCNCADQAIAPIIAQSGQQYCKHVLAYQIASRVQN